MSAPLRSLSFSSFLMYHVFKSQKLTPTVCFLRNQKAQKYCNLFARSHLTIAFYKEMFLLPPDMKEAVFSKVYSLFSANTFQYSIEVLPISQIFVMFSLSLDQTKAGAFIL